ncbi:MAG: stage IV sporulation protein A, partial [Clostridia bacterium]|nr:stage IV sporulation protein A [Clostridia bacterium]
MNSIYQDVAQRTNGEIYIGVVGPVRTGKSTFVTKLMQELILPNIADNNDLSRATDELPQSADGNLIMTTQPKFVPNQAVQIATGDKSYAKVRLIDCVGYYVEGAEGLMDGDTPRLVNTPWSNQPIPFEKAAEIGTQRVVKQHSTVAVVVTNDGSITKLPRANYVAAEERVVNELKSLGKPFVIVVNTTNPTNADTIALANALEQKYGVVTVAMDVANATKPQLEQLLTSVLSEFPVKKVCIDMPKWMRTLNADHSIIQGLLDLCKQASKSLFKMKDVAQFVAQFKQNDSFEALQLQVQNLGNGHVVCKLTPKPNLFYNVLSQTAGSDLADEYNLIKYISDSAYAKAQYDKIATALATAEETGYGVVEPSLESITFAEPEITKQGNRYGVKLKATAPSLHLLKIDVATEIAPVMGTEQQSQYLLSEFQQNPSQIWQTNMFGKSMSNLVEDALVEKCQRMPSE